MTGSVRHSEPESSLSAGRAHLSRYDCRRRCTTTRHFPFPVLCPTSIVAITATEPRKLAISGHCCRLLSTIPLYIHRQSRPEAWSAEEVRVFVWFCPSPSWRNCSRSTSVSVRQDVYDIRWTDRCWQTGSSTSRRHMGHGWAVRLVRRTVGYVSFYPSVPTRSTTA